MFCPRCGGRHAPFRFCPARTERHLAVPAGMLAQCHADGAEAARLSVYRRRAPMVLAAHRAMCEAVLEARRRAEVAARLDDVLGRL